MKRKEQEKPLSWRQLFHKFVDTDLSVRAFAKQRGFDPNSGTFKRATKGWAEKREEYQSIAHRKALNKIKRRWEKLQVKSFDVIERLVHSSEKELEHLDRLLDKELEAKDLQQVSRSKASMLASMEKGIQLYHELIDDTEQRKRRVWHFVIGALRDGDLGVIQAVAMCEYHGVPAPPSLQTNLSLFIHHDELKRLRQANDELEESIKNIDWQKAAEDAELQALKESGELVQTDRDR